MPKEKYDVDDPMELMAVSLEGSFDDMASGIVDEFILMGFERHQILEIFRNPFYRSTNAILVEAGEAWVQELIDRRLQDWLGSMA